MQKHLFFLLAFLCLIIFANAQTPDANGIVYVTPSGGGNGSSWGSATSNLQGAINANGVSKVFVAVGNYNAPTNSFDMKGNVAIYGGFNPSAGITTLAHNRVMPNPANSQGSILNGNNERTVVKCHALVEDGEGAAILDGFTVTGGNNTDGQQAGGIDIFSTNPNLVLNNLVIKGNTAFTGSAIRVKSSSVHAVLKNSVITGNTATYASAIELVYQGKLHCVNVTVANNTTSSQTGAQSFTVSSDCSLVFENSIVYGYYTDYGGLTINNSLREIGSQTDIPIADVFVNPSANDYTLKENSPAKNTGNNALYAGLDEDTKDLSGNPRLAGPNIDMGAYEFPLVIKPTSGIVYVRPTAFGEQDGSSWSNATNKLQMAIDATGAQQVYVGVGNYNVGTSSFVMKNGVKIYGGFDPANNNTSFANRIKPTETTDGSVLNGLNTRPVIWNDNNGLTSTAVLDGFTITGGSTGGVNAGAGITNKGVSPTFNNLVIKNNIGTTAFNAGGMYNYQSSPVVSNILFLNNKASNYAGAVLNQSNGTATFTNVIFKGNEAPGGSAIFNYINAKAILTNVLMTGNIGDDVIRVDIDAEINLINCTVANNNNSFGQLSNVTVTTDGASIFVKNAVVWQNISGSTLSPQYSLIKSSSSIIDGNVSAAGLSVTDIFTNPSAGDFSLKHPAVINKGNNTFFSGLDANTKDLAGNARLVGTKIDLGAYEYTKNILPDANGIIYVKATATGNGDGTTWNDATADLHNAIHAPGVTKVFVATGNYNVGSSSFVMKNGVAIYGGFNPGGGITNLTHNRILPTESTAGSVLNGENNRPVIWNNDNGLTNTAILDGFTLTNGNGTSGGAMFNVSVAPVFNNLVIKNNTATTSGGAIYNVNSPIKLNNAIITGNTAQYGGGVRNNGSASEFTNVTIKNNTATLATAGAGGGGIFNENSALKLTNVLIANNSTAFQGGGFRNLSGNPILTNVTIVNNTANDYFAIDIAAGTPQINNSIILGRVSGNYTPRYSMIVGNADFSSGNIPEFALNNVFTNPAGADYTLKIGSPAVNTGSNALFAGLTADTKDLAGKARVYKYANGGVIDMGAYESVYSQVVPDANGIAYVKADGTGKGSSWNDATSDLHTAIQTIGVQKVFVAKGNYNVGDNSFVMKNGVEIYGGFDPSAGITDLTHNRIMPNAANTNGSILNGEGARPVIWNVFTSGTAMTSTAILDGFTVFNGSYSNGAGIRNVYASPTFRNLVIRGNASTGTGAGIYNENSNPDIYNTVISGNMIVAPFGQNGMGAGIYNGTNSAPTIVNTTIVNNTITGIGATPTMIGAGVANLSSAAPKIYNSIIWNNQKNGVANIAGADIENNSATITLKNSITQLYSTGNNNKTGNPLFAGVDFKLQSNSPAVNAGSNSLYTFSGTLDLAGNQRTFGSAIDMGAYEYKIVPDANGIVYVKTDGTGSGATWADATSVLHDAIHTAGVTKVFVAKGNYNVGANSFIMKNGVEIYGGFDPANEITTLAHNRIMPNAANTNGSVLNGENTRPVIWNVFTSGTAMNNTAVLDGFTVMNGIGGGAGIRNVYASPTLKNLVIRDNNSTNANEGAGIHNDNSSPFIINSVIYNNTITNISGGFGAGIRNANSSLPTIINCSIIGNKLLGMSAPRWGAGVNGNAKIYNSIIWDNTRSSATVEPADIYGVSVVKNSITQEFTTGNAADNNLVGVNPMFTGAADFSLQAGSPAVNMGNNDWFTGLTTDTKDLAGNARVYNFAIGGIIDLGAYESTYNTPLAPDANGVIYVTQNGTGNRSGKDWNNATKDLHNAIQTTGVTKVFVATGNYPVGSSSFIMKNNVEIYGGFDPDNNIKTLADNRILPTETVGGSVLDGENARPVIWNVFTSGTVMDNTAILDGFTVYNGKYSNGGGVRNVYASPTLRNLVIKNNNASNDGGGMYNDNSSPIITKSIFTENTAGNNGGAMVNDYSYPKLTNVVIKGNQAGFLGGGITSGFDSSPVLTNVLIVQNTAATTGGGIYNGAGKGELVNVTIAGNTPNNVSLRIDKIKNSIIFGGVSAVNTLEYSFVQGNTDFTNGNIDAAGITETDIFNNPSGGDYTLKSSAVVINKGNNALFTGLDASTKDLAGNPRTYNGGVIDMGAYEYQGEPTLPVTLISFTAKADGNRAKLQWQTVQESNNKGFEIYRAESGKQKAESSESLTFIKIGEVLALVTHNTQPVTYNFTDNSPLNGNNYYKLVQLDNDGKATDLGIRTVNFQLSTFNLQLFPNPTTAFVTLSFAAGTFNQLQVIDLNGKVLQQHKLNGTESNKQVSLGTYPAGIYLFKLIGNTKTENRKVVKR